MGQSERHATAVSFWGVRRCELHPRAFIPCWNGGPSRLRVDPGVAVCALWAKRTPLDVLQPECGPPSGAQLPSRAVSLKAVHKESFQRQPTGRVFFVHLCCSVMAPWRRRSRAPSCGAQTALRAVRTDGFTRWAVSSECRPMRKPPQPPHPIPPFVAPRYGDTPEEDRAFRREMLLSALTDALFRLRCRQLGIELPSPTPPHVPAKRRRKAEPRA
jgi:hypothetical protein